MTAAAGLTVMHGFGDRAVAALRRFNENQPTAGVLLKRAEGAA